MVNVFSRMLTNLTNLGFYDFMLPWLLFVAIFFGVLQNKKTISEDAAVNGVIAIVSAFFVAYIAHGIFFTKLFGTFGIIAAGLLLLVVALGMVGIKSEEVVGNKTVLAMGVGALVILVFVVAGGLEILNISVDPDTTMTVFLLLIMGAGIMYIGGGAGGGGHE